MAKLDVREQDSVPSLVLHARDDTEIPYAAGRELTARTSKGEVLGSKAKIISCSNMSLREHPQSSEFETSWLRLAVRGSSAFSFANV